MTTKEDPHSNKTQRRAKADTDSTVLFPVVGIGASAGGLEALQEFFQAMPTEPGVAFVIIQHLSPDYKSLMDELLARHTQMVIHKVEDGMKLELNHIYLIPPRKNMTIFQGKLLLSEQQQTRVLNLPIDIFFRSLARDQEKNAIGIILSGTGSDGTLGIRAIKEYGGITMVQDDKSAKFDGMPRSSISTGLVDFILPPSQLAEEIITYVKHPFVSKKESPENILEKNSNSLLKIISQLRETNGVDFSNYKENTIIRRIEKRISINRLNDFEEYERFLANNIRESNILFNELLIGVTRFFREEESFKKLKEEAIIPIIKGSSANKEIRVWVPACSTGEEAYTLAILIKEALNELNITREIKIFATDLDVLSLEYAGIGFYPDNIASDVTHERLTRFFIKRDGGYQIHDSIRSMIIFAKQNILQDPPFSKIDLISCRNLLIYLKNETQYKLLSLFYLSLNEGGTLFLGSSESLGSIAEGFNVIDSKAKIFTQKKGFRPPIIETYNLNSSQKNRSELKNIASYIKNTKPKAIGLEGIFDDILNDFIPPSVIIDERYNIIHTIHQVSEYLTFPIGEMSLNLLKMLPKETAVIVNSLLKRIEKKETSISTGQIRGKNGHSINIKGKRIIDKKTGETYFLISFIDIKEKRKEKEHVLTEPQEFKRHYLERIEELEKELQNKSESLQATVEELETANEELQSSNEELIASNEELQSTNEELQSVNEELYTVNSEHIKKIEELSELYADMDNILRNTNIGTLFIDRNLTIRKINDIASTLTSILPSDIGRPLLQLSLQNFNSNFFRDIRTVLDTLMPLEKDIQHLNGNWYLMRIIPYRTIENAVEGLMVTFFNISNLKESQASTLEISYRLETAMLMGNMSWWEWDFEHNTVITGTGKHRMIGYERHEIASGYQGYTALIHPDDYEKTMKAMMDHLEGKAPFYEIEYRIRHKNGNYVKYKDKGGIVSKDKDGKPIKIMGIVINLGIENE